MLRIGSFVVLCCGLAACDAPPAPVATVPLADPARGLQVIADVGCGACHRIPGLRWPRGTVGPALDGFGDASLVAGHLPRRPDIVAAFVRDAPAVLPGTSMPAMPLTERDARDVAAYLLTLRAR